MLFRQWRRLLSIVTLGLFSVGLLGPASATAQPDLRLARDETIQTQPLASDQAGESGWAVQVSAGEAHTCVLTANSAVWCWGFNDYGQLGDGTTRSHGLPVAVLGLDEEIVMISAGGDHTCALTRGGGIKCWGWNEKGQLGDGTTIDRPAPVDVVELTSGVRTISSGGSHTCALTESGGVKCWGNNHSGQLGDSTTDSRLTPVDVVGLASGVQAVSSGNWHTCAVTASGGLRCWGANYWGQLGDSTTDGRLTPVDVVGLSSGITVMGVGGSHTCAATTEGGLKLGGISIADVVGAISQRL